MRRAAIYTRISLDRDGRSQSPERQEAEARRLAEGKGWQVLRTYSDRDVSAFKRGVRRPEYEAMQGAIAAGEVDAVAVYSLTRLARSVQEFSRLLAFLDDHGAVVSSASDPVDTSTPSGRAMTQIAAVFAELESATISARVSSGHAYAASQGRMHTGGSRQFGYTRDGEVIPDEAAVIHEAARRLLDGESLRRVAFDLNDRGVTTTTGKPWRSNTLGQMIRSPRLAGLRVHNGEVHAGDWPAILAPDEHARLLEGLTRPATQRRAHHLLTGLAVCGLCGGALKTMGFRMSNGKPFERYQCVRQPGQVNCGKVAASKAGLERVVVDRVLSFLSRAHLVAGETDPVQVAELTVALEADAQALVELTQARFVHRLIDDTAFATARDQLMARRAETEARLGALRHQQDEVAGALRPGERADLDAWWQAADAAERRAALAHTVRQVTVNPAAHRGGNKFQADRVAVSFRTDLYRRALDKISSGAKDHLATEDDD